MASQDFPKNYFLVSMTAIIGGKRKFVDIPLYSHKLIFPSRITMYGFFCDHFGIPAENTDVYNTFAVIGVYKFECEDDFNNYIHVDVAEESYKPEEQELEIEEE